MNRLGFLTALLGGLITNPLPAAPPSSSETPGEATVQVSIPADFPLDLPTVLQGTLSDPETEATRFQLVSTDEDGEKRWAQKDLQTGTILIQDEIGESQHGRTIQFAAAPSQAPPHVRIVEKEGGYEFRDGKRSVLFYQRDVQSQQGKYPRADYVHPLHGLDGEILTQDFPDDHPHHRGIFWAWHQIWAGQKRAGDGWTTEDFLAEVQEVQVVEQGPLFATLEVQADWISPQISDSSGQPRPVVHETTSIRLFRSTEQTQYLDFEIQLRAALPHVKIGGAENKRGYSGFTVRIKPPRDMQIFQQGKLLENDAVGTAGTWVDVNGTFGKQKNRSGVAILSHPSLPEFPPKWLLRHYGMQNVVYPGRHPIPLSRNEPLTLRHRVVMHRGNQQHARIAEHQKVYQMDWQSPMTEEK